MKSLSELTNGKLIKELEKRDAKVQSLVDGVFSLVQHRDDRFGDIIRANPKVPSVIAYEAAFEALSEAKYEGKRRVGPVTFDMVSTIITYLQNQGLRTKPKRL